MAFNKVAEEHYTILRKILENVCGDIYIYKAISDHKSSMIMIGYCICNEYPNKLHVVKISYGRIIEMYNSIL